MLSLGSKKKSVENTDDHVVVFEGDPMWLYKLHKELSIVEWIKDFYQEFGYNIDYKDHDSAIRAISGITLPKEGGKHIEPTMPGVLTLLSAARDKSEYWQGPGPVSGENYIITLPRHGVPEAVKALEELARRLPALVPSDEQEYFEGLIGLPPVPEKD